jgi:hypothetical protein
MVDRRDKNTPEPLTRAGTASRGVAPGPDRSSEPFAFISDSLLGSDRFRLERVCTLPQEPVDYEAVLADLEAKRAVLDSAIAALRQVANAGGQLLPVGGLSGGGGDKAIDPASIRDDAFFGLSIGEAGKKYLQMVKRKQSVKEIADALERGGLPHTSANFVNTVGTMMNRAAAGDPELVRVGRGEWGLAGWYGNRRPKPEPPKKVKRAKRKTKAVVQTKAETPPPKKERTKKEPPSTATDTASAD